MPEHLAGGEYRVSEYRVQGDTVLVFDWRDAFERRKTLGELDGQERTIYVRPMGETAWGWHSGPFRMDHDARASHCVEQAQAR